MHYEQEYECLFNTPSKFKRNALKLLKVHSKRYIYVEGPCQRFPELVWLEITDYH